MISCMGVEFILSQLEANFEIGELYWKGGKRGGKKAGFLHKEGYWMVCLSSQGNRHGLLAHRVIWAMKYGAWPSKTIDHIDGDRLNNRIANLRLASYAENNVNRGAIRDGLKGACFDKRTGRFIAQINVSGKNRYLGRYDTEELAHSAYMSAARHIYGEFARS